MLAPLSLRHMIKSLTACAVLALAGGFASGQSPSGPAGSVVFYSAGNGHPNNQIYTMNPDGSDQKQVTFDTASDVDPDISPDGKYIVFTSDQTGNNDIFIMDRSGTALDLTNNPANDEWARFSPEANTSCSIATATAAFSRFSS